MFEYLSRLPAVVIFVVLILLASAVTSFAAPAVDANGVSVDVQRPRERPVDFDQIVKEAREKKVSVILESVDGNFVLL